jgi:serine/threonine protein kinase
MAATHDLDEEDGAPIWGYAEGDLMPGGQLAVTRLGIGIRCETWLAWSTSPWCPVVVKLARPHQVEHPRASRALRRESVALAGAAHPAMPRLIADGIQSAVPHLVMEYVDGPSLADELDRAGATSGRNAVLLGAQILAVVADLHARGLAHLDLKPENVVLRDGRPVVIDYGSARVIGAEQPAGYPIGTEGYAAPEQEECRPISPTMDCYGVGAILYESLTDESIRAERRYDLLPAGLAPVVTGLLEPDPARRLTVPQAMYALADVLPATERPWPAWADAHLGATAREPLVLH